MTQLNELPETGTGDIPVRLSRRLYRAAYDGLVAAFKKSLPH